MKRNIFLFILGGCFMINAGSKAPLPVDPLRQIWVSGVDPVVQKDRHVTDPPDYMDLFKPDAPWATASAATNVFKVSTQFILRGTDEQVRTVIDGLRNKHIALAVEFGVLTGSDTCGMGAEGFGSPASADALCKKIQRLGGQLDYIAMDEPVTWGHEKGGTSPKGNAYCQYSIPELVDRASIKIATLQRYFPDVKIGLIDAVNSRLPHLADDIIAFVDQLHKKTGLRPAFMHADVAWDSDWLPMWKNLLPRLRARGIRVGIVFDGNVQSSSDREWIAQALGHFHDVMADPSTQVDDLVFQTWSPRPAKMLPETDPDAWTYAVKYAATHPN